MSESESKAVAGLVDSSGPSGGSHSFSEAERRSWDDFVSGGWHLFAAINQGLAEAGLPQTPDWRVLEALSKHDRLRISDLASITQISLSTVSRQITRLVEAGRVERVDGADDGRQRWVRVTTEGRCYLVRAALVRDKLVRQYVIDVLTPEEFEKLGAALAKVHRGIVGVSSGS
ncbi:MarR family winged helix-turn-helix transcriptional regulator [Gordonia sp. CPCC 205333]|uniref:MarR family winged helix-turn-helix transcriptional regulator n=1 Tax=Gordonia sp. CPCC 205333 TaxID=3140790 RepID=UPI003AF3C2E8